jgi:hypothetical protein
MRLLLVTRIIQSTRGRPAVANRFLEADEGRDDGGGYDPEDYGRRVREFALDAHRALGRPDGPIDEVIDLHRRAWSLLREAPGVPSSPLRRWLVAVREAINARLRAWAMEEFGSLVA